jgi:hypothetical protein
MDGEGGQNETVSLKSSDLADMLDMTRVRGFHLLALVTIDVAILWAAKVY